MNNSTEENYLLDYIVPSEPTWNLERRESSGQLIWRRESSKSKVRFLFDVEVLEYEKNPEEHLICYYSNTDNKLFNTFQMTNSLFVGAVLAVTLFLPWYLLGATH